MATSNVSTSSLPLVSSKPGILSMLSSHVRDLLTRICTPFAREYRQWPWTQIGTITIVCIGSYSLYRWLPGPYHRYFMSSTRNFSRRYNKALHEEKEKLFGELKNIRPREHGKKLQIIEIGAAHGANLAYYPPQLVELICVEPIRDFDVLLAQNLRQHPHVTCRELLIGCAENISVIRDNQVDAVVSTLTLSSCQDVDKALREIRRILRPGGIFIYMENIRSPNVSFALLQFLCNPIYKFLFGISLIRNIPDYLERAHFPGGVTQEVFIAQDIPLLLKPHVMGIARK